MEKKKHNNLAASLSPYLRQHADNPVEWHEWGPEIFSLAEAENRLLLISIGYSACHWCHVMAHECFEDEETAARMNKMFVCVKVDREQHPEVDMYYMDACRLVSGNGGWPLNAFALPDGRPVHALTYAPRVQWNKILHSVFELWSRQPHMAFEYAEKLSHGIRMLALPPSSEAGDVDFERITDNIFRQIADDTDRENGGRKGAPKFPMPVVTHFLLRYAASSNDSEALGLAVLTMKKMALGGIFDAIGGGFARYATDDKWFVPHFEKMLYDNAQLISLYAYGFSVSHEELLLETMLRTAEFCIREWKGEEGLYYSATDADSGGGEGLYYTFTADEIKGLLAGRAELFMRYYRCTGEGNWEHGRNILSPAAEVSVMAPELGVAVHTLQGVVYESREKLAEYRTGDPAPEKDDKCICSWNAMLAEGLADAAFFTGNFQYADEAAAIIEKMNAYFGSRKDMKRIRSRGKTEIAANLDDRASLCKALLALYRAKPDEKFLFQALKLCEEIITLHFRDNTGFFEYAPESDLQLARFDTTDDVIPSSNAVMAYCLWQLSWYFQRSDLESIARNMCLKVKERLHDQGPWHALWASVCLAFEKGTTQFILALDDCMQGPVYFGQKRNDPKAVFGYAGEKTDVPLFQGKEYKGRKLLYPCQDHVCMAPEPVSEQDL